MVAQGICRFAGLFVDGPVCTTSWEEHWNISTSKSFCSLRWGHPRLDMDMVRCLCLTCHIHWRHATYRIILSIPTIKGCLRCLYWFPCCGIIRSVGSHACEALLIMIDNSACQCPQRILDATFPTPRFPASWFLVNNLTVNICQYANLGN